MTSLPNISDKVLSNSGPSHNSFLFFPPLSLVLCALNYKDNRPSFHIKLSFHPYNQLLFTKTPNNETQGEKQSLEAKKPDNKPKGGRNKRPHDPLKELIDHSKEGKNEACNQVQKQKGPGWKVDCEGRDVNSQASNQEG